MSKPQPTHRDMAAQLQAMQTASQGVWDFEMHATAELVRIVDAGLSTASAAERRIFLAFESVVDAIDEASAKHPRLCLTCDAAFRPGDFANWPGAVAILEPHDRGDAGSVIQALCQRCCAGGESAVRQRALTALGFYTGTTMREVHPGNHAPGHA